MALLTAGPKTLEAGWENYANKETPTADPSNFTYRTYTGTPDALSANVELYWDYSQGANKTTQFCLLITDGTATYAYRVPAVSATGTQKHRVDLKQLKANKALTISIAAEFVASSGVVQRAPVAGWSFTPNTSVGSSPTATQVGTLDWAGGNVWFDTEQYRNNYAPTNAPNPGFGMTENATERANQFLITLTGIGYSQGANIATHIAVFIRIGGGSVSITSDAIITLLNLASLPASYAIPYPLHAKSAYTFGIAACALTKDGYSFNGTVREIGLSGAGDLDLYSAAADINIEAATGGKVIKIKSDVTVTAGKTIDGRDVGADGAALDALDTAYDAHAAAASAVHGTTGAVMGANMTNTPGASFQLICKSNGKLGPRHGSHATNWPTTSDMADGEMVKWWNEAVGTRMYLRDGDNMFWWALT